MATNLLENEGNTVSAYDLMSSYYSLHQKVTSLSELKTIVDDAYDVTICMQSMDMLPELRQQFKSNRNVLQQIRKKFPSKDRKIRNICLWIICIVCVLFSTYLIYGIEGIKVLAWIIGGVLLLILLIVGDKNK